jgi:ankyrin repeat protein
MLMLTYTCSAPILHVLCPSFPTEIMARRSRHGLDNVPSRLPTTGKTDNVMSRYKEVHFENAELKNYIKVMREALAGNYIDVVKLLLRGDNHAKDETGENALTLATHHGCKNVAKWLLKHGADVNARGPRGTALNEASANGHEDIVKLLLRHKANVDIDDESAGTALLGASAGGHRDVVMLLLEKGADVNAQSQRGSALSAAAFAGHLGVVKILLDKGADIHDNALQCAIIKGHKKVARLLHQMGASIQA